jgi:hypothetical protein
MKVVARKRTRGFALTAAAVLTIVAVPSSAQASLITPHPVGNESSAELIVPHVQSSTPSQTPPPPPTAPSPTSPPPAPRPSSAPESPSASSPPLSPAHGQAPSDQPNTESDSEDPLDPPTDSPYGYFDPDCDSVCLDRWEGYYRRSSDRVGAPLAQIEKALKEIEELKAAHLKEGGLFGRLDPSVPIPPPPANPEPNDPYPCFQAHFSFINNWFGDPGGSPACF